ncbi:MAG: response regulator [Microgenomates group bacterium]|jgi:CheY-like chemotaxis protein
MKKILVVDDERSVVEVLTKKLISEGYEVGVAYDGQEALDKIAKEKFDLVLLDIIMPVLDGMSVLKRLKESEETKNIPVIVLTNLQDDDKILQVVIAGQSDYLIKANYSLEDLVEAVRKKIP